MAHIVKVFNLIGTDGTADYKGLDLSKIVAGTQLYPPYDNVAYFKYTGDVFEHDELQLVTQAIYDEHKTRIDNLPKPTTVEDRVVELEGLIMMAVMEGRI